MNVGTGIGAAVGVMAAAGKEASGFATTNQNITMIDGPLPVGDAVLYARTAAIFAGSLAEGIGDIRQQRSYMQKVQCEGTDGDAEQKSDDAKDDKDTIKSNLGNEIDVTPSPNHSSVDKNPGKKGEPNSSVDILDKNGNIKTRRWFDSNGNAYRDVDMSNHGNPSEHPEVPHEHIWKDIYGKLVRH